ncbi:uncharacterized protein LOC141646471 [Silene latifolia]|uniref:uncharacterized protein LOC141646471 n=1 Tax=Silene latifolia TaxID=37657 RepID=UPI003D7834B7
MSSNASIVQGIQDKIDRILGEAPKLFQRLDVVLAPTAVWDMLTSQDPVLRLLRPLLVNIPSPSHALNLGGVVSSRMVADKREELKQLTNEVVLLFERIRNVLSWDAVVDICRASRRIVNLSEGQHEYLRILDVYCDHLESLHEDKLREERLRELDSSPSSDDSYSR